MQNTFDISSSFYVMRTIIILSNFIKILSSYIETLKKSEMPVMRDQNCQKVFAPIWAHDPKWSVEREPKWLAHDRPVGGDIR